MYKLDPPYEYSRECWCFRTIARIFSRSSSVSRAPKLGMSARTCSVTVIWETDHRAQKRGGGWGVIEVGISNCEAGTSNSKVCILEYFVS